MELLGEGRAAHPAAGPPLQHTVKRGCAGTPRRGDLPRHGAMLLSVVPRPARRPDAKGRSRRPVEVPMTSRLDANRLAPEGRQAMAGLQAYVNRSGLEPALLE